MTLRKRIERLERAAPQGHERLIVIRRIVSRRPGGNLTEVLHSALIIRGTSASGERLVRRPDEGEDSFRERVLAAADSCSQDRCGLSPRRQPH